MGRIIHAALFCTSIWLVAMVAGYAHANTVQSQIAEQIAAIKRGDKKSVDSVRLTVPGFVTGLYALREYQPLWDKSKRSDELVREIIDAQRHGFRPKDFSLNALLAMRDAANNGSPSTQASFDIAATEIAARLLHHIYFGKVDPVSLDPTWSFERAFVPADPVSMVNQYLEAATLGALIDEIEILHPAYRRLQEALDRYMAIAANGDWPQVPEGAPLRFGDQDERVLALQLRLAATGDFTGPISASQTYEDTLLGAVEKFQMRHGLEADGVVGPKTLRTLNRTVFERISQLRASLERARWLFRDLGDDYVFVNIGGPETYLVQGGETVWKARSIVGQAYRQTPVFRDAIEYMEFNPTWTVPVSIFREDKLPLIRRDPGYLMRGGYEVLNSDGQQINPNSVDWSGIPNVTLRQEPGPKNALGQVKFMFPNKHSVYLHDTDDRTLFDRNERNLSSGCVRIEKPFELADLLMRGDLDWSPSRRDAILASGRTTRVTLPEPVPVLLTYFTAWMDETETIHFREDIYGRDAPVLSALDADFQG